MVRVKVVIYWYTPFKYHDCLSTRDTLHQGFISIHILVFIEMTNNNDSDLKNPTADNNGRSKKTSSELTVLQLQTEERTDLRQKMMIFYGTLREN